MFPTTLKKYIGLNRVVCILFTMYMLNAFTLVNLFITYQLHHLNCDTKFLHSAGKLSISPPKSAGKALYLFLSHRKIVKASVSGNDLAARQVFAEHSEPFIFSDTEIGTVSHAASFQMSDDAYKRYRKLRVFLI